MPTHDASDDHQHPPAGHLHRSGGALRVGERPFEPQPRKFVITYKQLPGEPQFVATIGSVDLDPKIDDGTFRFNAPKDFTRIKLLDRPGLKKDDKP